MNPKHIHYSWVMVILSIIAMMANGMVLYTFGIFLIPITTEFGWERGALSIAHSVMALMGGFLGIVAGRLCDKYGPRSLVTISSIIAFAGYFLMSQIGSMWQLYFVWGLLMGISFGFCTIPVTSTIPRWFAVRKRGIAQGLVMCGFGLGAVVWPSLAQWLISAQGWREAYIVLAVINVAIMLPVAQFMKHSPQVMGLTPYGESVAANPLSPRPAPGGLSLSEVIRTRLFWLFGITQFCFLFIVQTIIVHTAPYAIDSGISSVIAASILSIMGMVTIVGRLGIGVISDRTGPRIALTISFVALTLAMVWIIFTRELWMFYIFAAIAGIAYGGESAVLSLVPAELFGLKNLGTIAAISMLFGTIGGAIGSPLAGTIYDKTGSYNLAFLISIFVGSLAIVISLILLRVKGYENSVSTK